MLRLDCFAQLNQTLLELLKVFFVDENIITLRAAILPHIQFQRGLPPNHHNGRTILLFVVHISDC